MANWHEQVFFGLHFDLHANAADTVLGRDLTPEHLRQRLLTVRPDWVQCDCKGHAGYTSWPTRVGSTSPGVVRDALRIHRDVTRELGLPLVMHYSGVWDTRALELHPEWAVIDAAGKPSPNNTCRLSAYRDELMIPQMLELVREYDVDGFWVDGENWASQPCWCPRCRAEYVRRGGGEPPTSPDQPGWAQWLAFQRDLFVAHVTAYADAVHAVKPACTVVSNWMYTVRQPDAMSAPVDYLSGDYDWIWGADRAAVEGRLLDGRRVDWDLMAWGFTKSGEMSGPVPWCTKTAVHLCAELAEVVALGGAVSIYDNPQRGGRLTDWHMATFGQVAEFCRERDVCRHSVSRSEVAVLHLADSYYAANDPLFNYGAAVQPVEGALHALLETQHSTDLLTAADARERLADYKLVVVPEQTNLSPALAAALEAYAAGGGRVLLSGAHLAVATPELVGARRVGEALGPIWLPIDGQAAPLGGDWYAVEGSAPAVLRALDQQEVEANATQAVVVTRRAVGAGAILAVHGPFFRQYFLAHFPLLRRLIGSLIEDLGIAWDLRVEAPARVEVIARRKDGSDLINLLNRGAAEMLMPRRTIIEELAPALDVTVGLRRAAPPAEVSCVPATPGLEWSHDGGWLTIRVPRVEIHTVLAVQ
jgi:hypothetical protein